MLLPSRVKRKKDCLTAAPTRFKHFSDTPPISNACFKFGNRLPWAYTARRSLEDRSKTGRLPLLATPAANAAFCLSSAFGVVIVSNRQPDALFSYACRLMVMHAADSKVKSQITMPPNGMSRVLVWFDIASCRPTTGSKGLDPFRRDKNQRRPTTPVVQRCMAAARSTYNASLFSPMAPKQSSPAHSILTCNPTAWHTGSRLRTAGSRRGPG